MAAIEFGVPRGAILFEKDGFKYEFRDSLGEAHHGLSLFVARRRTMEGNHPRGRVLLKAVAAHTSQDVRRVKRARQKLEEQVRLAMFLDHPAILRVHGLHKAEGASYVITEHPSGHSVRELLALAGECGHTFSPLFVLYLGAQVAAALAHAHEAKDEQGRPLNIVHRAIDLGTLFVDWKGGVQVADFGLALSSLPGRVSSTVHRPQGDAFYSSPEMLLTGRIDARSDLFALGVVMLELATGKNLLDAPDEVTDAVKDSLSRRQRVRVRRAIKRAHLADCHPLVGDAIWRAATYTQADLEALTANLPQGLGLTLLKLLQRSPDDRYPSARELATDLGRWLGGEGVFGKAEAEAELLVLMKKAGSAMAELGIRRPRGVEVSDEVSTH
ncbi:protein kinase domain-containing protein [Myxococcus fulvus]|uniref:protein kinase domain-containing protein n=1 Tax=Myxococcus fulvus TaxID=33 RepID=UPI003B9AE979